MNSEIETAISNLAKKSGALDGEKAHQAMQLSQAALNLAHAAQVLKQVAEQK